MVKLKGARGALMRELRMSKEEIRVAKKEVESSHMMMITLKNDSQVLGRV